jgi:hypothetical protein
MSRMRFVGSALVVLTIVGLCGAATARQIADGTELLKYIADGTELLKNPRFERGALGWLLQGGVSDPDLRHGESACVRLER